MVAEERANAARAPARAVERAQGRLAIAFPICYLTVETEVS